MADIQVLARSWYYWCDLLWGTSAVTTSDELWKEQLQKLFEIVGLWQWERWWKRLLVYIGILEAGGQSSQEFTAVHRRGLCKYAWCDIAQAVGIWAIVWGDEDILRYQGLGDDLKNSAQYKYHTIPDYDRFNIELRKVWPDMKVTKQRGWSRTDNSMQYRHWMRRRKVKYLNSEMMRKWQEIQY